MSFGVPGAFGSSCRAVERPRRAFTVAQFVKDDADVPPRPSNVRLEPSRSFEFADS